MSEQETANREREFAERKNADQAQKGPKAEEKAFTDAAPKTREAEAKKAREEADRKTKEEVDLLKAKISEVENKYRETEKDPVASKEKQACEEKKLANWRKSSK